MCILEIGLTIWAWNRGWRTLALFPVGIGLFLSIFVALILYDAGLFEIYAPNIAAFIFVDLAALSILVYMIARPRNKSDVPINCKGYDSSLAPSGGSQTMGGEKEICSRNVTVSLTPAKAKLVLPDNREITITESIRPIGRTDFLGLISSINLQYVSRQHFWIRSDKGKYFIEDYQSSNGTKLDGVEITGKGLHALEDGSNIDVAGIIMRFKILP